VNALSVYFMLAAAAGSIGALPDVNAPARATDSRDFDKYFFFHRPETAYEQSFADIRQCDALSTGLTPGTGNSSFFAGVLPAIGIAAIASGNRRALRRLNMRRCMFFKGYDRYGLAKAQWLKIGFEEGDGQLSEARRIPFLEGQARLASGARPRGEVLGE
jgi:hypothetical protein